MPLKRKKKICEGCGDERYIFSKGKCQQCASSQSTLKSSPLKQSYNRIKPITEKKRIEKKETAEKREVYFDYHIKRCTASEESYKPISNPGRSNICHLFDKSRHPSLQDNLVNCIYLTFKEHERFDYLLYNHEFSKLEKEFKNSYEIVCNKLYKLLPLCEENTVFSRKVKEHLDERKT